MSKHLVLLLYFLDSVCSSLLKLAGFLTVPDLSDGAKRPVSSSPVGLRLPLFFCDWMNSSLGAVMTSSVYERKEPPPQGLRVSLHLVLTHAELLQPRGSCDSSSLQNDLTAPENTKETCTQSSTPDASHLALTKHPPAACCSSLVN